VQTIQQGFRLTFFEPSFSYLFDWRLIQALHLSAGSQ